jgi:hypothetical protein
MDHLLVMPLTPFEIALSKVWANGLVIAVAVGLCLYFVVRMMLGIPVAGSIPLFMVGVVIYLFFATAIGIFLGTVARSMPQLGLLYMLVFLPMNMLSGSNTPLESMPLWLARVMQVSPSTHFVAFAQSIFIVVPGWTWCGRNSWRLPSSERCFLALQSSGFVRSVCRRPSREELSTARTLSLSAMIKSKNVRTRGICRRSGCVSAVAVSLRPLAVPPYIIDRARQLPEAGWWAAPLQCLRGQLAEHETKISCEMPGF